MNATDMNGRELKTGQSVIVITGNPRRTVLGTVTIVGEGHTSFVAEDGTPWQRPNGDFRIIDNSKTISNGGL